MKTLACSLSLALLSSLATVAATDDPPQDPQPDARPMHDTDLGAFSVSLAVKDLEASRAFYEKLGFAVIGGAAEQNWLILRNGQNHVIGLFQGMFEQNILTFNPGWSQTAEGLEAFQDVREIQAALEDRGLELLSRADPDSTGVASCMLVDPDGNPILIDQHVPKPGH